VLSRRRSELGKYSTINFAGIKAHAEVSAQLEASKPAPQVVNNP